MSTPTAQLASLATELREFRAQVAATLADMRADIASIDTFINGPPRDGTVRERLHTLENAVRDEARADAVMERLRRERRTRLSGYEKIAALALVIVGPLISALILHAAGLA